MEIRASTEVKPSNEIEIHKAKKDSKFNFILISDCLADIYPTQKSQFNSYCRCAAPYRLVCIVCKFNQYVMKGCLDK